MLHPFVIRACTEQRHQFAHGTEQFKFCELRGS